LKIKQIKEKKRHEVKALKFRAKKVLKLYFSYLITHTISKREENFNIRKLRKT